MSAPTANSSGVWPLTVPGAQVAAISYDAPPSPVSPILGPDGKPMAKPQAAPSQRGPLGFITFGRNR
jgi:hypothetical protein